MGKRQNFKKKYPCHGANRNNKKPGQHFDRKGNFNRPPRVPREKRVITPFCSLKEDQVGITEYVRESAGFTGIIKARFSDFHVNEIDAQGNEVKLTDQTVPVPEEDALGKELLDKSKKELESIVTDEIWQKIQELLQSEKTDKKVSVDIDVTDVDKEKRTSIHKTIKEEFGSAVISTTATVGEKKFIQCFKAKGHDEVRRTRWSWPGEYVYFVVHKENIDTVRAASDLARNLRLRPSGVNYAGTKDKRAKTSQLFCVKKRDPQCIARAARDLRYMKIGNFTFKENVLKLGDLKGNRFRIAIRQVDGDENEMSESLKSIKENGFINYYGLQRFGNCAGVPTFDVGIALLKSDYKEACELILKPRDGEPHFMKEIRELWWKNRNSAEAASKFYDDKFIEKKLLDGLAQFGENDCANALRRIPRNMLLLYTHAYQSLVWNRIASRRVKEFGLKLIPGDLVYKEGANGEAADFVDVLDVVDAECIEDTPPDPEEETENNDESQYKAMVKPLTEEDISSNKYSIFDVVLPLPGHDITYPSNDIAQWYEDILAEKELTSPKLKHNVKTYSLAGAYRKLLAKPENMSWEFKRYNSPTCTLIASDIEELKGVKPDPEESDGGQKALILDFSLPSSAYATMALREVLKTDTSVANQQKITQELNAKNAAKDNGGDGNEVQLEVGCDGGQEVDAEDENVEPEVEENGSVEPEAEEDAVVEAEAENGASGKRKADDDAIDCKKAKVE